MVEPMILSELGVAYMPHARVMLSLETEKKKPVETIERITMATGDYHFWGDSNDYPQTIIEACKPNPIIGPTISWKANQVASGGIRPGYWKMDDLTGEEVFMPYSNPEIKQFIRMNNLSLYLLETLRDMYWFNHAFADFGLDESRKKIVSICAQDASECRFGKQNEKTGLKDKVYLNANWPLQAKEYISMMPALDPYYDVLGQIRNGSASRYIYPLYLSMPGKKYYQDAPWHSIIDSKWLDIAAKIPKLKSKLMDNQMSIKYVIHVPLSWWTWKFPDWSNMTPEVRKTTQETVLTNFNSVLTGVENQGKTLMLTFKDDFSQKEFAKWEIKELNSRIDANTYIEDSQESVSYMLYALNVDATLIGNSPGKGMGAGSGSDKRSAFNIFIQSNKIYQDVAAAPLNMLSAYNNWLGPNDEEIVWQVRNQFMATQDQVNPKNRQ